MTVSKLLQYGTCKRIKPKGNKKDSFYAALDDIFHVYNRYGYTIATIHADREFKPPLQSLEDDKSVVLNLAAANEHIPEIEKTVCVCKERLRACHHRLYISNIPLENRCKCNRRPPTLPLLRCWTVCVCPWPITPKEGIFYSICTLNLLLFDTASSLSPFS